MPSLNPTRTPSSPNSRPSASSCPARETVELIPRDPQANLSSHEMAKTDRIHVFMRGLGPYLRALAARRGMTPSGLIRSEVARMAREEAIDLEAPTVVPAPRAGLIIKVAVSLTSLQALTLASRARTSGVSKAEYLRALLDGDPPPTLPSDHAALVSALRASTDRLAAASVDLNAFMRLLNSQPSAQIDGYRAKLRSLTSDVQSHLEVAAAVLAQVKLRRRVT
jgi:hypothetical protein